MFCKSHSVISQVPQPLLLVETLKSVGEPDYSVIVLFHKYVLPLTSLGRNTRNGVSGLTREGVVVVDRTL